MKIPSKNLFMDGNSYQIFSGNCVYIWRRGKETLYVGSTSHGLGRVFGLHHVINHVEKVTEDDEIEIIPFKESSEALLKEIELIQTLAPKYNPVYSWSKEHKCKVIKCLVCGKEFKQTRFWQKYCSIQCKQTIGPA